MVVDSRSNGVNIEHYRTIINSNGGNIMVGENMGMNKSDENHMENPIDDVNITRIILERFYDTFIERIECDIIIVGAGPAGLAAARYLARSGKKVVVIERKLSVGGGMWGGGMTFPVIVIQKSSLSVLQEVGVNVRDAGNGYYTVDSIECVCKLCAGAIDAGAKIFNAMSVEDVMYRTNKLNNKVTNKVNGVVINWSAVEIAGLHVDPLCIGAKAVVDATGHAAEICKLVQTKVGNLDTKSGKVEGERSMWANEGERTVVENTNQVYPGLYVAGMAANAVMGSPRMGPIFGGMLLSGKKVAGLILKDLTK